jgi:hypothetical protein
MPNTTHREATEPTGWRANHIEETIRSVARLHAEHHENATPPQRAADRITALLGPLLMAGRRSFAGVALHGHLDPGHPAARVPACPTPRAAHLGVSHLERAEDGEGHTAAGRVPSRQSAHSQPGRSGSRSHGSACRPVIGARHDQGDSRRSGANQRLRRQPLGAS